MYERKFLVFHEFDNPVQPDKKVATHLVMAFYASFQNDRYLNNFETVGV